ncbi:bacillithiol biosynthesis cysteine-adding enzyme BshC [Cytobacillus sp. FJAT-54145]|uniref:Putative cysteine ligase BshC n=1 Tax=Cytobacillus spartinae TaxID=3299023 RepID=A0ABW6KLB7_9BACI
MEILDLFLPATNRFATEYTAQNLNIQQHFHYSYQSLGDYQRRLNELNNRTFMRNELVDHIAEFMNRYPSSDHVIKSLDKLRQDNSVVVIGGQQAGILTGPLYTIHKIISIVHFAKQKELELKVPVIPVFWIAGEDHDYDEVNHIFMDKRNKLEKWTYPERVFDKRMVSDISINKEIALSWVKEIIETLGETEHTKNLVHMLETAIKGSDTFVDFFAFVVMELFKDEGLLIIDSGNKQLRKLEKDIFIRQIDHASQITSEVKSQQEALHKEDFPRTIDITNQAANLFYYDEVNHERVLLEFSQDTESFSGKNGSISFTKAELLEIASETPEKLSNNVVTRPLSQEWLFPTLAFIAGPGEISYWAELKKSFELFGMKMPPIVPRMNITLLERNIESDLQDLELDLQDVLVNGTKKSINEFLGSVRDQDLNILFTRTKEQLLSIYGEIEEKSTDQYRGLLPLLKKNEALLLKQIGFMEGKFEEALKLKHTVVLEKFDRIDRSLKPAGAPQERMWNVLYYLNKYGLDFLNEILKLNWEFNGSHKVVKL